MASTQSDNPKYEISATEQFTDWLVEQDTCLVFTTYQAGKLFIVGADEQENLTIFNRTFNRVMGLCVGSNSLYLSDLYQLWRFENTLKRGQHYKHFDRCFLPQMCWTTGDLDIHDIDLGSNGKPVFVNTLFNCIATVSETHSFKPVWRPDFISQLAAEDRCHLNGMAMINAKPAFVTSVSTSNIANSWRQHRQSGGVVIDVLSNNIVLDGLSMPHSPRWYQDRLWLLDSGTGFFGYLDQSHGTFERVASCPGYARGLSFINGFAIVGLSKPRHNKTFSGLQLDDNLKAKNIEPQCGLIVIDLNTGNTVHSLKITGIINELFDVSVIKNSRAPMAIGFQNDEISRLISIETDDSASKNR